VGTAVLDAFDRNLRFVRPIVDDGDGDRDVREISCPVVRRFAFAKPAFVVGKLVGSPFEERGVDDLGDLFVLCEPPLSSFFSLFFEEVMVGEPAFYTGTMALVVRPARYASIVFLTVRHAR